MKTHPLFLVTLFFLCFIALAGCATFDQRLNTAVQIHAATTRTVTSAHDSRLISTDDARAYESIALNSSAILDSARALKDEDPETAEGKLHLANSILTELRNFLLTKVEKQP